MGENDACPKCGLTLETGTIVQVNGVRCHKECNVKYCAHCKGIVAGSYVGAGGQYFHKECAGLNQTCKICKQPLKGAMANTKAGKVHSSCLNCATCKKNVVSGYIEEEGLYYCPECFELKHPPIVEVITTPGSDDRPSKFGSLFYSNPRADGEGKSSSKWDIAVKEAIVYEKEGTLTKKGEKNTAWKTRFFGIRQGKLDYMKEKNARPLGTIELKSAKVMPFPAGHEGRTGSVFGVQPAAEGRIYYLEAPNESERSLWVKALVKSGAVESEAPAVAAAANAPPPKLSNNIAYVHEGTLLKKGDKNKAWKERFFGICEGRLDYMKEKGAKPHGSLELKCSSLMHFSPGHEGRSGFVFGIQPPGPRVYSLEASTEQIRSAWIAALLRAGATEVPPKIYKIEGTLFKKGEKNKAWKERHFGVEESVLEYTKGKGTKALGMIDLKDAKAVPLPNGFEGRAGACVGLKPAGVSRMYVLEMPNDAERGRWLQIFREAGCVQEEYAGPTASVYSVEGILLKKGEKNKAYRERFFGLQGTQLKYMKTKGTKELGFLELKDAKLVQMPGAYDGRPGFIFGITPSTDRTYLLEAPTELERDRWTKALVAAGCVLIDFVKTGVDDGKMEGMLFKKGEKVKAYKARYCVIDGKKFVYSKAKGAKKAGEIDLVGAVFAPFPQGHDGRAIDRFLFGITPANSERTYILEASTEAERSQWLRALERKDLTESKSAPLKQEQVVGQKPTSSRTVSVAAPAVPHSLINKPPIEQDGAAGPQLPPKRLPMKGTGSSDRAVSPPPRPGASARAASPPPRGPGASTRTASPPPRMKKETDSSVRAASPPPRPPPRPAQAIAALEAELAEAIKVENWERCVVIRDNIAKLKSQITQD